MKVINKLELGTKQKSKTKIENFVISFSILSQFNIVIFLNERMQHSPPTIASVQILKFIDNYSY